jgi:DnaJ-class molecular chaperone
MTWRECESCEGDGEEPRVQFSQLNGEYVWTELRPCAQCAGFGGAMACKRCAEQQRRTA